MTVYPRSGWEVRNPVLGDICFFAYAKKSSMGRLMTELLTDCIRRGKDQPATEEDWERYEVALAEMGLWDLENDRPIPEMRGDLS